VQRTGLRPGGTGRVCWQWLWFAMESCSSALPLTPAVRQPRAKTKSSLNRKFGFSLNPEKQIRLLSLVIFSSGFGRFFFSFTLILVFKLSGW
jgi:hypothetical protein